MPSPHPSALPSAATATELPPDYDKEMEIAFWNAIKGSKSPAVLQTYLDRFPRGTFAGLARVMLDQLKREESAATAPEAAKVVGLPAPPAVAPSAATTSPLGLARALQTELKRVGCDPGSADGNWGTKSRQALDKFARFSKLAVPTGEPSEAALEGVAGQLGRICPLDCGKGETELNGTCVATTRPEKRKTVARPPRQNQEQPQTPGFRLCVGGRALGLCTN